MRAWWDNNFTNNNIRLVNCALHKQGCLCPIVFSHSDSVCVVTEKSRAFSPHSEAKKQALGPDDLRTSSLGRPVLSPYPMSPRDMAKISHEQHLLHLNCEFSPLLSGFIMCFTSLIVVLYFGTIKPKLKYLSTTAPQNQMVISSSYALSYSVPAGWPPLTFWSATGQ